MKFFSIYLAALVFSGSAIAQADKSLLPQDYKCGISIRYAGTEGVDWIAEDMFHDPIQNNRRTIYIRGATDISMYHNELNVVAQAEKYHTPIGAGGADGIAGNADDGTIRYRIDGDLNGRTKWSDRPPKDGKLFLSEYSMLPAYTAPFAFEDLTYAPLAPGVSVVGTIGGNGQPITDRTTYYHRGMLDSSGDEWHTICIGDDDYAYLSTIGLGSYNQYHASDGKMQPYLVNPKTPCITVANRGDAQFYTTMAKVYFTPVIHDQTTYIQPGTGSISITLTDLYGNDVHYRINGGAYTDAGAATVTLDDSRFSTGSNTLECYYEGNEGNVRTRTIFKNPPFPSAGESHGNLMWKDSSELAKITGRLTRAPYLSFWDRLKGDKGQTGQDLWPDQGMIGKRWPWYPRHPSAQTRAFENAFIASVLGWDAVQGLAKKSYAAYAREMLLDNVLNLDFLGFESPRGNVPSPTTEVRGAGYYMVKNVFDYVAGYDMMIANYRSDQHAGGITPIEDYFMRDQMAGYAFRSMQWHGKVVEQEPRMWGNAEGTGALIVTIAMPDYDTSYYGTSGFNGTTTATHAWAPYPDQNLTWKKVFVDQVEPTMSYPNQNWQYNPVSASYGALLGSVGDEEGYWTGPDNKMGYWSLMTQQYCYLTNLSALHTGVAWPAVHKAFLYSAKGEMRGESGAGATAHYYKILPSINSRFPTVESAGRQGLLDNGAADLSLISELLWFDDGGKGSGPSAPKNLRPLSPK